MPNRMQSHPLAGYLNRLQTPAAGRALGSRAAGEGTRNFTIWDDSILTTLKRNDEPIR